MLNLKWQQNLWYETSPISNTKREKECASFFINIYEKHEFVPSASFRFGLGCWISSNDNRKIKAKTNEKNRTFEGSLNDLIFQCPNRSIGKLLFLNEPVHPVWRITPFIICIRSKFQSTKGEGMKTKKKCIHLCIHSILRHVCRRKALKTTFSGMCIFSTLLNLCLPDAGRKKNHWPRWPKRQTLAKSGLWIWVLRVWGLRSHMDKHKTNFMLNARIYWCLDAEVCFRCASKPIFRCN